MSKKVYLRREDLGGYLPKAVRAEATMKLSSVYVNRQPLKGFDRADETKYMQGILDVDPGIPLNIMDFIKYSFAIKHPHVALTKAEMDADFSKRFYLQDTLRDDKVKNNQIKLRKDADKEFIKVSSNEENMKRILRLMSNVNPDRMTSEQIENSLYEIKNNEPKKFIRVATDKNLELKAEIEQMISAGVLRKIGNQVIFIDEVLGDTMNDTVVYLKDKKNSGTLTILRSKLKELSLV